MSDIYAIIDTTDYEPQVKIYRDVSQLAGVLEVHPNTLRNRFKKTTTFKVSEGIIITRNVEIIKSKRGASE